jgi:hypothetical protein
MLAWLEDGTAVKADDVLALVVRIDPPLGREPARILVTVWIDSVPGAVVLCGCSNPDQAIAAELQIREAIGKAERKLFPVAPGVSIHPDKLRIIQVRPDPVHHIPWSVFLEFDGGPGNFVVLRCLDAISAAEMARHIASAINEEEKTFYALGEWIYIKRDEFEYITCRTAPDGRRSLHVKLSHKDGLTLLSEFPDDAAMQEWLEALRQTINEEKDGDDRIVLFNSGWGFLPNHIRLMQPRLASRRVPGQGDVPVWSVVVLHEKFEQPVTLAVCDTDEQVTGILQRYREQLRAISESGKDEDESDEDGGDGGGDGEEGDEEE